MKIAAGKWSEGVAEAEFPCYKIHNYTWKVAKQVLALHVRQFDN